jgi:hypothetical protein
LSSDPELTSLVPVFGESDRFGTYEKVKLGADVASVAASTTGVGAAVSFTAEVALAGNGMTAKERGIWFLTLQILEAQVDHVASE